MKTIYCNPKTAKLTRRNVKPAYESYRAMLTASGQYTPAKPDPESVTANYDPFVSDAYYVVKYLESRTPSDMLKTLYNDLAADNAIRTAAETTNAYAKARYDLETQVAAMLDIDNPAEVTAELDRQSNSLLIDDDTRAYAADMLSDINSAKDDESRAAQDTTPIYSNAADLVQVAALADHEPPTDTDYKAASKSIENLKYQAAHHNGSIWNSLNAGRSALAMINAWEAADEMHGVYLAYAIRAHRRAAIRQYIRSNSSVNALDGTNTTYKPATNSQIAAWINAGHMTGKEYSIQTKSGTKSLVYHEGSKSREKGWYWYYTSRTYRKMTSIEQLTASTDKDGKPMTNSAILSTANLYIDSQSALEELEELANRANLNERQRQFIAAFCSRPAQAAESAGRLEYIRTTPGATNTGADAAGYTARRNYAFDRIGIKTPTNRTTFFSRLKTALLAGAKVECTCITPQEYFERDFKHWEKMQHSGHRGTDTDRTPRPACYTVTATTSPDTAPVYNVTVTDKPDTAPVIDWMQAGYMAEQDRKPLYDPEQSYIDNSTPEARKAARKAAKAYNDKQTALAAAKAQREAKQAENDRITSIKAKAHKLDVATLHTTFAMWQKWTDEQKQAHSAWLDIISK